MRPVLRVLVTLTTGLLAGGAAELTAQQPPLAEVARREAERRRTVSQASKVYTEADTKTGRPLTIAGTAAEPSPGSSAAPAGGVEAEATASGDRASGHMDSARLAAKRAQLQSLTAETQQREQRVASLEETLDRIESEIERNAVRRDLEAETEALGRLREAIEALQHEIATMESAAAQTSSPPAQRAPRPPER